MMIELHEPPPPPSAVPLPRERWRIQIVQAASQILPCEAGEGNHAQHGGGGVVARLGFI